MNNDYLKQFVDNMSEVNERKRTAQEASINSDEKLQTIIDDLNQERADRIEWEKKQEALNEQEQNQRLQSEKKQEEFNRKQHRINIVATIIMGITLVVAFIALFK